MHQTYCLHAALDSERYHLAVLTLVRRIAARLGRNEHASGPGLGLPCTTCGKPATGWAVISTDRGGTQVIDAYAACDVHQGQSGEVPSSKVG